MPELTISIVNNNNRELLDRCLHTVYETTVETSFEILLVDNCSGDGSVEMVKEKYPEVRVLENERPMGFSENHNRVLREMNGEYVVLLNEDTEMKPGCFDTMHKYMSEHPDVGCLGPRILNPDGTLQQSVYRMPSLSVLFFQAFFLSYIFPRSIYIAGYKKWPHDETAEVQFMIGACLMLPGKVIEEIGLMDERYFIYAEDADVCRRVMDAGKKVVFLPDAGIMHHGGSSMKQIGDRALHNSYRSMHLFFEKYYGRGVLPAVAALNVAAAVNRVALFSILRAVKPGKKDIYDKKIDHFKRVLDCYINRRYKNPQ